MNKWYKFDVNRGYRQKRPRMYKLVLVKIQCRSTPELIMVGYRKDAAGDKSCPYFVTPGFGGGAVIAWRDCLNIPDDENLWRPEFKWRV